VNGNIIIFGGSAHLKTVVRTVQVLQHVPAANCWQLFTPPIINAEETPPGMFSKQKQ